MTHRHLSTALGAVLLTATGAGAAMALIGTAVGTETWGDLTTPALLAAGLLAFALGSLVFTPRRRRT